ncbi:MAG: cytochrome c [Casimicrobiaceae bacterium]|nr:cytochrome c [Casimicrobiaceae bacterium]MCX8098295.1 cytochrome c [Casimicrobiaceae bacterium]MDW8311768.1 cytochrome c [Burkholderiales bacterium]
MKLRTSLAVATAVAALAGSALAQPKPENFVKQRQSAFALIGWYFSPLGPVARGEQPFNKADAEARTARLVVLSAMPWEGFAPGTDKVGNTKAKPEIWTQQAKFKAAADKMQEEIKKLADLAKAGDEAGFKRQVGVVGGACKACHDDFRMQ